MLGQLVALSILMILNGKREAVTELSEGDMSKDFS